MLERVKKRITGYSSLDWALFALVGVVIAALAVLIFARLSPEANEWDALSYFSPAQIITADGMIPEVPNTNYDIPSLTEDSRVPTELVRFMDCQTYRCPLDQLPYILESEWVLVSPDDGDTTTVFSVLEDFSAALTEGSDYTRGEVGLFTRSLRPQPVPDVVLEWIEENGGLDSRWKIRGTVLPLLNNANTVAWETGTFVIVHDTGLEAE